MGRAAPGPGAGSQLGLMSGLQGPAGAWPAHSLAGPGGAPTSSTFLTRPPLTAPGGPESAGGRGGMGFGTTFWSGPAREPAEAQPPPRLHLYCKFGRPSAAASGKFCRNQPQTLLRGPDGGSLRCRGSGQLPALGQHGHVTPTLPQPPPSLGERPAPRVPKGIPRAGHWPPWDAALPWPRDLGPASPSSRDPASLVLPDHRGGAKASGVGVLWPTRLWGLPVARAGYRQPCTTHTRTQSL